MIVQHLESFGAGVIWNGIPFETLVIPDRLRQIPWCSKEFRCHGHSGECSTTDGGHDPGRAHRNL